jgi:hypothetical protein
LTRPPRGGNPIAIKVQSPTSVQLYDTEDTVHQHATDHLSLQFHLAYSAPCYSSQILHDLGHLGDTQCTQDILDSNYSFPPDTDQWTIKILQEAHHSYKLLNNKPINTTILIGNFQSYYQQASKKISSSNSRLHFGHYKAVSYSRDLSALHAAQFTACLRKGLSLKRWGVGLTVLLEKTCGNNHIHKMCAIVLLKGDFNYYNKTIFA